jgi:maleylacetate reductase
MKEGDVPRIAALAVTGPYANTRPVARDGVEALVRATSAGETPAPLRR